VIWKLGTLFSAAAALFLLAKLLYVKKTLGQLCDSLCRKLHEDTNTPITTHSADGAVRRFAAELNRELGKLRKEKLRLESGNHALQNAVTNAAHDLRTPLTAISGYVELMERELPDGKAAQYLSVIRERTEALKALTRELFRYSVIDDTADMLQPETAELGKELEIALAAAYQTLSEKSIVPVIRFPEGAVVRSLDRRALQRIFGNILSNGAKYSDGDLSVTLYPEGRIVFSNAASALSEIEVGKLFDRFYTVESAQGSTGLGLSIAKLLTEKMGGSIAAQYREGRFSIEVCFP